MNPRPERIGVTILEWREVKLARKTVFIAIACTLAILVTTQAALAGQEWISDIINNKSRYWNRQVTVTGQVQTTTANPPGTTRGTYTLIDDSGPVTLTVRTKDLPPLGKTYRVTGYIIQDPTNADNPILDEADRTSPGLPPTMKILLFGGGALFLILLIVFIVLLVKPRPGPAAQATIRPTAPPAAPTSAAPLPDQTTKLPTEPAAPGPAPDKTQVFLSLGAELTVEKGPDKDKEFTLHKQVTTIGRPGARKNDIELQDDTVSKEQTSLVYDNAAKTFSVNNESTTNPTRVNGQVTTGVLVLKDGDQLEMGRTILRFKQG